MLVMFIDADLTWPRAPASQIAVDHQTSRGLNRPLAPLARSSTLGP